MDEGVDADVRIVPAEPDLPPGAGCLQRFDGPGSVAGWRAIDDRVMGGISRSRLVWRPAAGSDGHALFEGEVSLERNGGFASVRSTAAPWGRAGADSVSLLVRGDGRRYKLILFTDDGFDSISHQAGFQPPAGSWARVQLPLAAFQPTRRGRLLPGPVLDPADLRQVGLMVADRQAGPFALALRWIALDGPQAARSAPSEMPN